MLIPIAFFVCLSLIAVIFSSDIAKFNAERDAKLVAEVQKRDAELVAEIHNLTPDIQKKFIDNIKSVLYVFDHYGDKVPNFELTGNAKLDNFISRLNQEINNTNEKLIESKKESARKTEPFEKEAKRLALGGADNVDRLADIGRTIDELSANEYKPIEDLGDKYKEKLSNILNAISPKTSTTTTMPENMNPETKPKNEISDINKANKEVQKSIVNESTEFLLETKDRKILRWSNYTEENNNYCTSVSHGKFCVPKSEVVSISEKAIRTMQ